MDSFRLSWVTEIRKPSDCDYRHQPFNGQSLDGLIRPQYQSFGIRCSSANVRSKDEIKHGANAVSPAKLKDNRSPPNTRKKCIF